MKFNMKKTLDTKNYIAIADWMLDLNLNTRELLTYALIYGFSQDGEGYYYGSLAYLANWLGINDRTNATRYLNSLVDKNLVIKREGRSKYNQKVCLYRTLLNKGAIIDNPDVDYIVIQPWMLQDMHLNGKDLLLYALIHGYSRKGSGNVCQYNKEYFAKWMQCRKDNVDRQINRILNNGIIKKTKEGLVAVVPNNITVSIKDESSVNIDDFDFSSIDNTFPQTDNTYQKVVPQSDNTFPQTDNTPSLKLTTNNLYIDNLIDNLVVVVEKKLKKSLFDFSAFNEANKLRQESILEGYGYRTEGHALILRAMILVLDVVNNYSADNIKIINSFTSDEFRDIFDDAIHLSNKDPEADTIDNHAAKLSSKIKKYIIIHKKH